MRVFCVQLLLCGAASHCAAQGFQFLDFKSARGFNVVGDAKIHGKAVRLTPARHNKSGAFWMEARQPVTHGFDTTFRFQLTEQDHQHFAGADGFAFVVQNEGAAVIAGRGSAAGWDVADGYYNPSVRGIARSLAIFFDTFWNEDLQDPSGNYIAICTNGDGHWPARRLAYSKQLPVNLKDKRVHVARILFSPPKLSVYLDDSAEPVLTAAVELPEIAGPQGTAFVGFTAATGAAFKTTMF